MTARATSFTAAALLGIAMLIPVDTQAQSAALSTDPVAVEAPAVVLSAAPTLEATRIALRPLATAERSSRPAVVMQRSSMGRGQVLMIVGGAAFLAGAIIGDDAGTIMMIGGAGIGLYGLYIYLQ